MIVKCDGCGLTVDSNKHKRCPRCNTILEKPKKCEDCNGCSFFKNNNCKL